MTIRITICDPCRRQGRDDSGASEADGERLAALAGPWVNGNGAVRTQRQSCVMGCDGGRPVAIQGRGGLAFAPGDFTPDAYTADATTCAGLHGESPGSRVPCRQWPHRVTGHFNTRHPPAASARRFSGPHPQGTAGGAMRASASDRPAPR